MTPRSRRSLWIAVALLGLAALALAGCLWLPGYLVRSALELAGASEIRFQAVHGTPGHLAIDDLSFRIRGQSFAAGRVTLQRSSWWAASLGDVQVEGARLPVVLDASDVNPWNWTTYDHGRTDDAVSLPFRALDLDGQLVVQMAALPDMPIDLKLEARPKGGASWTGRLVATGPGFRLAGDGSLLRAGQELNFQVQSADLDLVVWSRHVQRLVLLPGSPWDLGGKLAGVGEGRVTANRFAATARVSLREGWMKVGGRDIAATGAEADLEFSDLWKYRTKSAVLRIAELRAGRLPLRDVTADFGLWDRGDLRIERLAFSLLGGRAEVAPFRYRLDQRELAVTLQADGVEVAELLALMPAVPVKLSGRVGGTVPLFLQPTGVRIAPGFLALQPGGTATLPLRPAELLRSGAVINPEGTKLLKAAGSEPMELRLQELRVDVRPPGAPLGVSARIHAAGQTDAGPLVFDFNVNGAVEKYLRILPESPR